MSEEAKNTSRSKGNSSAQICVLAYAPRDRTRGMLRTAFSKKRVRVVVARTPDDFAESFKNHLVDAAIVDLYSATEETWRAANLSIEFPSTAFFGMVPMRAADGPVLARCATLDFADILAEGIDDGVVKHIVTPRAFTTRFSEALSNPPQSLGLTTSVQVNAWKAIVAHAGRTVTTDSLAKSIGISREHLSRGFSQGGAPNLKRIIDLVRMISAAELAKNPGYDMRDVAKVLGFASSSHIAVTAQRVIGTRPASLSRLRTIDLVEKFVHGRTRSRVPHHIRVENAAQTNTP